MMSADSTAISPPRIPFGKAIALGIGAGIAGAAGMTMSNWLEQAITARPAFYVPGRTFAYHFGLSFREHPDLYNQIHHWGMGIVVAPIRAVMSFYGVVGPVATFLHMGIRLFADQLVENTAGTSGLPWTWPMNEQVIDLLHKGVYAIVTGWACDRWIRGLSQLVGLVPWQQSGRPVKL